MGGKLSRNKGHGYERDIAKRLRNLFPKARRQLEYHTEDAKGIDLQNTGNLRIQCKRYKDYCPISKIEEVRGNGIAVLITKGDHKRDVACLYLDDFINILEDIGVVYEN